MSDVRNLIEKYLNSTLGIPKRLGYQLQYNCPNCSAGNKHNLEICCNESFPKKYLKFNCWSCHYKGYITTLLKDHASLPTWRTLPEFKTKTFVTTSESKTDDGSNLILPKGMISFHLKKEIKEYLIEERKMSEEFLFERNIKYVYNTDEPLYDHILFPFYENKQLVGISAQNFSTKKYRKFGKQNFIPYFEFINPFFPVIFTEGVYDAGSVINAIPLLGTDINYKTYKFCQDKNIIIALDDEVSMKDKQEKAQKILRYGGRKVIIMDMQGYKDLNKWYCTDGRTLKDELLDIYEQF